MLIRPHLKCCFYNHCLIATVPEKSQFKSKNYTIMEWINELILLCDFRYKKKISFLVEEMLYSKLSTLLSCFFKYNGCFWMSWLPHSWRDGLAGKGTYQQAQWPEFYVWDPHGEKKELAPASFSVISIHMLQHVHKDTNTQMHQINK